MSVPKCRRAHTLHRIIKNPNVSTEPLARPFTYLLALLTCSLALHCMLCSLARSLPHPREVDDYFSCVFFREHATYKSPCRSVGPSVHPSVCHTLLFLHFWAFKGLESLYLSMPLPKSLLPLPNRPRQEQSNIRPCSILDHSAGRGP